MKNRLLPIVLFPLLVLSAACGTVDSEAAVEISPPARILVAHRGASGYAPEHSIEAYELGIEQGADYVEPDIQITRDGVLIALHDLTLERTTNVRDVFPSRSRKEEVDGELVDVWLANDFTIQELRQLDAGSWFGQEFAGTKILTLSELVDVVRGRTGLLIETKAPEVYGDLGFSMEELLLAELTRLGLDQPGADPQTPIIIQSFSAASLQLLRHEYGTELPLALLIGGEEMAAEWLTPDGLITAANFATGIGPAKDLLLDAPGIVALAHEQDLVVIPWTFRADNPGDFQSIEAEMAHFLDELGVDGIITNHPDRFPRTPPKSGS